MIVLLDLMGGVSLLLWGRLSVATRPTIPDCVFQRHEHTRLGAVLAGLVHQDRAALEHVAGILQRTRPSGALIRAARRAPLGREAPEAPQGPKAP
jgi:hypothetical protein